MVVGSQSVSQSDSTTEHAAIACLTIAGVFVCTESTGPAKAARLPSHARPILNYHHLDHRRTIHMACQHGGCGLPLGSSFREYNKYTRDRHPCLPLSALPSPSRSIHQTTPPIPPPSSHRLTYPSLSLALLYICPPLVADRPSPGCSCHLDRDPLVIHFTRQRSGTARTVFIGISSSGHRISKKPRSALTWYHP